MSETCGGESLPLRPRLPLCRPLRAGTPRNAPSPLGKAGIFGVEPEVRRSVWVETASGRRAGSVPPRFARLLRDRPFGRASRAAGRSTARPAMQRRLRPSRRLLAAYIIKMGLRAPPSARCGAPSAQLRPLIRGGGLTAAKPCSRVPAKAPTPLAHPLFATRQGYITNATQTLHESRCRPQARSASIDLQ